MRKLLILAVVFCMITIASISSAAESEFAARGNRAVEGAIIGGLMMAVWLGVKGIYGKLTKKKGEDTVAKQTTNQNGSKKDTNLENVLIHASHVISDFGDFMREPNYPVIGCVADVNSLPHDKKIIKDCFKLMMSTSNDTEYVKVLFSCYNRLADFQEGVGDKVVGFNGLKYSDVSNRLDMNFDEDRKVMQKIARLTKEDIASAEPFKAIQGKELAEMDEELKEIIAVRKKRGLAV